MILDPDQERSSSAAEQFGADLKYRLLVGLAKALGKGLAEATLDSGPWTLHADGRVEEPWIPELDWVITGGESGPGYRDMPIDAVRNLREQCAARRGDCEPGCEGGSIPVLEGGVVTGGRACECQYPNPVPFFFKQHSALKPHDLGIELDGIVEQAFPVPVEIRRHRQRYVTGIEAGE